MKNELDLPPPTVGTGPTAQRDSWNIVSNEPAQFVSVFDAPGSAVALIAAQDDQ